MLNRLWIPVIASAAVARAAWTCPNALTVELAYINESKFNGVDMRSSHGQSL
jgi:hypothetical protein